jgi:hypothetical protein
MVKSLTSSAAAAIPEPATCLQPGRVWTLDPGKR